MSKKYSGCFCTAKDEMIDTQGKAQVATGVCESCVSVSGQELCDTPRRILVGFVWDFTCGGIDQYLRNFDTAVRRRGYVPDYLTNEENEAFSEELIAQGSHLFVVATSTHSKQQYQEIREICEQGDYYAVYLNYSTAVSWPSAKAAHDAGCPRVIIHSHSTGNDEGKAIKRFFINAAHAYYKRSLYRFGTHFMGCSKQAGYWLFPAEIVDSSQFKVVHNPVDVSGFAYNPALRARMREELGLGEALVIGSVGAFRAQKNTPFLIEVFAATHALRPDAKLIIVGDGASRPQIEALVQDKGLTDAVLFMGKREDVATIEQAFDVFVLPSLFEGLCVAALEAQASGLKCVLSTGFPPDVEVTDECLIMSLQESPKAWADAICSLVPYERTNRVAELEAAGYSPNNDVFIWLDQLG